MTTEAKAASEEPPDILGYLDHWFDEAAKPIPIYGEAVKLKFGGELRYRLELRDDFNFNDATYEDDAVNLFRTFLNLNLDLGPYLRIFAEGQDSESVSQSGLNRTSGFVDRPDLRQLYAEIKSPWKRLPLRVLVGRQEFFYGDGRFVDFTPGFANVANSFDAVRMVYSPVDWFGAEIFFAQPVEVKRDQADSAAHHDNFYGLHTALKPIQDHTFDTFFFIRHDRNNEIVGEKPGELGQLKEYTLGNRFKGKKRNFDYGIEWAVQFGSRAHDDVQAWAWHNEIGYTFDSIPWDPRVDFEYNHGSGDSDPTDGTAENFDNLFPRNHEKYGYIDFASLRNIHHVQLGIEAKPHPRLKLSADYHRFFLDTNGSAWFNAGQKVIRPARAGASATLGQELDLWAKWSFTKHLALVIGYSHFHAGAFVKDTGAHDNANFFYTQISLKL